MTWGDVPQPDTWLGTMGTEREKPERPDMLSVNEGLRPPLTYCLKRKLALFRNIFLNSK